MNSKMMNAAVLHAVGDLRYEQVPMPEAAEDEVLLKIKACGTILYSLTDCLRRHSHVFEGSSAAVSMLKYCVLGF